CSGKPVRCFWPPLVWTAPCNRHRVSYPPSWLQLMPATPKSWWLQSRQLKHNWSRARKSMPIDTSPKSPMILVLPWKPHPVTTTNRQYMSPSHLRQSHQSIWQRSRDNTTPAGRLRLRQQEDTISCSKAHPVLGKPCWLNG